MKKTVLIVRIFLSLVCAYKIYEEAGIYTGIFAVLMLIFVELLTICISDQRKINDLFQKRIKELEQC